MKRGDHDLLTERVLNSVRDVNEFVIPFELPQFEQIIQDLMSTTHSLQGDPKGVMDDTVCDCMLKIETLLHHCMNLLSELDHRHESVVVPRTFHRERINAVLMSLDEVSESLGLLLLYLSGRVEGLMRSADEFLSDSVSRKMWINHFGAGGACAEWSRFVKVFERVLKSGKCAHSDALREILDPLGSGYVRVYDLAMQTARRSLSSFYAEFLEMNGKIKQTDKFGTYSVQLRNGRICGEGTWTGVSGNKYLGQWKDDVFDGTGHYLTAHGSHYYGQFRMGKKEGRGVYVWQSGHRYDGEWLNDMREGYGIFIYGDGYKYFGQWEQDVEHGQGTLLYSNGDVFSGGWANGLPNGEGVQELRNGDRYEGSMVDGRAHGRGRYEWACKDVYEGDFVNGVPSGEGIFTYANGDRYVGSVENGKEEGLATYEYTNGDVYRGMWHEGVKCGPAVYTWVGQARFEGSWLSNQRNGPGKFYWPDGTILETNFREERPFGRGMIQMPDGAKYESAWWQDARRSEDFIVFSVLGTGKLASEYFSDTYSPPISPGFGPSQDRAIAENGLSSSMIRARKSAGSIEDPLQTVSSSPGRGGITGITPPKRNAVRGDASPSSIAAAAAAAVSAVPIPIPAQSPSQSQSSKHQTPSVSFLSPPLPSRTPHPPSRPLPLNMDRRRTVMDVRISGDPYGASGTASGTTPSIPRSRTPTYHGLAAPPVPEGPPLVLGGPEGTTEEKTNDVSDPGSRQGLHKEEAFLDSLYTGNGQDRLDSVGLREQMRRKTEEGRRSRMDSPTLTPSRHSSVEDALKAGLARRCSATRRSRGSGADPLTSDALQKQISELMASDKKSEAEREEHGTVDGHNRSDHSLEESRLDAETSQVGSLGRGAGMGVIVWANADKYTGQWKNRKLHGHGRFEYSNGDVYEGQWENSQMHGRGSFVFANGHEYTGKWRNGKIFGKGVLTYPNRDTYEGELSDGLPTGQGVLYASNGDVFSGEWKNGKLHGRGACQFAHGYRYEGDWEDGMRHGYGEIVFTNGNSFKGQFSHDLWEGNGVFQTQDDVLEGQWHDSESKADGIHGFASLTTEDGYLIEGTYTRTGGALQFWFTFSESGDEYESPAPDVFSPVGDYPLSESESETDEDGRVVRIGRGRRTSIQQHRTSSLSDSRVPQKAFLGARRSIDGGRTRNRSNSSSSASSYSSRGSESSSQSGYSSGRRSDGEIRHTPRRGQNGMSAGERKRERERDRGRNRFRQDHGHHDRFSCSSRSSSRSRSRSRSHSRSMSRSRSRSLSHSRSHSRSRSPLR